MSGHSKWSSIKHKKGAADAKRGKLFSKLTRAIIVAARDGGPDPAANLARKETLCERAEQLTESTEWDNAASEVKKLQAEWKTIGPIRHDKSEVVWYRFRSAADKFFERYHNRHKVAAAEQLAEREAPAAGRLQQPGDAVRFQVGHGHLLDAGLLQQIVGTGGPLEPSAQNQHAHRAIASERA